MQSADHIKTRADHYVVCALHYDGLHVSYLGTQLYVGEILSLVCADIVSKHNRNEAADAQLNNTEGLVNRYMERCRSNKAIGEPPKENIKQIIRQYQPDKLPR